MTTALRDGIANGTFLQPLLTMLPTPPQALGAMRLCVGDDWAEDHHDIEVMGEAGQVLATRRLPEGWPGSGSCTT